jgi:adenylate kinase
MGLNILLLGPQGAGKGTQAKRIAADYGLPHVATGDMLRAAIEAGTPLGVRAKPIYDRGELVPDELMIDLIRERLGEADTDEGFILDGFPRTMKQAEALDAMLREIGRGLTIAFELRLPDQIAVERLLRRAELERRPDDTPEAIATRLALYHEETEPLVDYYRTQGNLVGIHADRPEDEVFFEIQQALEQAAVRQ